MAGDAPTLLVFGGSQGAKAINGRFAEAARMIAEVGGDIQIIHFTGTDDNVALQRAYASAGLRAEVRKGDPHIENAYVAADLGV